MALTTRFFAASTVTNMVAQINAFLALQPLTLQIRALSVVAHDLTRFIGIEFRVELVYDPLAGNAMAAQFTVEAFDEDKLPILQQEVNAAIVMAPTELWLPLPLIVSDKTRLLDRNLALFLRNPDASAIMNFGHGQDGQVLRSYTFADTPVAAEAGQFIEVDATGGAVVVDLPSAVGLAGQRLTVIKADVSANLVTVTADGAETINGAATAPLAAQYNTVTLQSNGIGWYIVAEL